MWLNIAVLPTWCKPIHTPERLGEHRLYALWMSAYISYRTLSSEQTNKKLNAASHGLRRATTYEGLRTYLLCSLFQKSTKFHPDDYNYNSRNSSTDCSELPTLPPTVLPSHRVTPPPGRCGSAPQCIQAQLNLQGSSCILCYDNSAESQVRNLNHSIETALSNVTSIISFVK